MKCKSFAAALLAAVLLFALTACTLTRSGEVSGEPETSAQTSGEEKSAEGSADGTSAENTAKTEGTSADTKTSSAENSAGKTPVSGNDASGEQDSGSGESSADAPQETADESWKEEFEKSLLESYNVKPEYYEDLGDGIYQVYVDMDGKVVPFVTVDSATGDYHG